MWTVREYLEEVGFAHARTWWLVYDIECSGGPTFRTEGKPEAIKLARLLEQVGYGGPPPAAVAENIVTNAVNATPFFQQPREGMLAMALSEVREHGRTLASWARDMRRSGHAVPEAIEAVIAGVENANA
mgnify:CR=1 FL=1